MGASDVVLTVESGMCQKYFRAKALSGIRDHSTSHFLWDQTMQMHGNFEGFSLNSALFGLAI